MYMHKAFTKKWYLQPACLLPEQQPCGPPLTQHRAPCDSPLPEHATLVTLLPRPLQPVPARHMPTVSRSRCIKSLYKDSFCLSHRATACKLRPALPTAALEDARQED